MYQFPVEAQRNLADSQASLSPYFLVLANPTHQAILELLRENDLCACDIQLAMNLPRAQVLRQLKILEALQFVSTQCDEHWTYYSLNPEPLKYLMSYLENLSEPLLLPASPCGSPGFGRC